MKKLILTNIFILLSLIVFSQDKLTFTRIIKTDSIGVPALFAQMNQWFAQNYKSPDKVIQLADKEAGMITASSLFKFIGSKFIMKYNEGPVNFSIIILMKDNRIKVEITNFVHTVYDNDLKNCELGLITNAEIHTEKGLVKNQNNQSWNEIKVKAQANSEEVFTSIETYLKQNKPVIDNW